MDLICPFCNHDLEDYIKPMKPVLGKIICPFCTCDSTVLSQKEFTSVTKNFRCMECKARFFVIANLASEEKLNQFSSHLEKRIPSYKTIIPHVKSSSYKGKLICPVCLKKIDNFKLCETKPKKGKKKAIESFHWTCNHCTSNGFSLLKFLPRWKYSSSILRMVIK